jgi:hypothetical protein
MWKVACSESSMCFRCAHNLHLVSVGYVVQAFFVQYNRTWHDQFVTRILQYKGYIKTLKLPLLLTLLPLPFLRKKQFPVLYVMPLQYVNQVVLVSLPPQTSFAQ